MDTDRWQRIKRLYHEALERPIDQRDAFLDACCQGNELLRGEVASLLAHEASAESFLVTPAADVVAALLTENSENPHVGLEPGVSLGTYRIERPLGRGGMGVVFLAHDATLRRQVALKVLGSPAGDATARARLLREARNAAALNHPNICTVYEVGEADGHAFIAMEYVDGVSLSDRLAESALPLVEAVRYGIEAAAALAYAHDHRVIHRDLKAANAIVTKTGRLKLVDFGLARREDALMANATTMPSLVPAGAAAGTPYAMAPEQVRGDATDARSDIWALGVLLYEMVTGAQPFTATTIPELFSSILRDSPAPMPDTVPVAMRALIERCLNREPDGRYQHADEVRAALEAIPDDLAPLASGSRSGVVGPRAARRLRRLALATLAIIVALAGVASVPLYRWQMERSRQAGLREVESRIDVGRYGDAYRLVRKLEERIPHDAEIQQALLRLTYPSNVRTIPPGAEVYLRDYADTDGPWQLFGTSPIDNTRVPFGALRWKIAKEGFDPVEGRFLWGGATTVTLHATGTSPQGMVFVSRGAANVPGIAGELPDYWIDKYEVSNREFKKFVDEGGYRDQSYWKHPFVKDGQPLSWEQAVSAFRDKTGRPGPTTWELGAFPEGQADYPVLGISWYEAAAFAEFAGKSLPTIAHWRRAVGPANFREDAVVGNFGGRGPEPISELKDLGPFGTYGLAGNVREWCWNSVEDQRYILGGGWNDPPYMSNRFDALLPFDRSETNGVRLVKYGAPPDPAILGELQVLQGQFNFHQPVGDDVFKVYRSFYSYDRTPLETKIGRVEETKYWRQESVSFAAAYGKERVLAHLLLPKNAVQPYQAVIWFPGSYALNLTSSDPLTVPFYFDFLVRSGRAVIHPIYQGTYERGFTTPAPVRSSAYRDMVIQWSKDLGRTIDYLETRSDIDSEQLAYYVISMVGPTLPLPALEQRLKTLILVSGGLVPVSFPMEVDPINFAPRIKVPVLLLGGRYDYQSPVEDSQVALFNLFGTPAVDKSHVIVNSGHVPERAVLIREILEWLDRYLGPVKVKAG